MSPLYVYAFVDAEPRHLGTGLAGEPLRLARCQEVMAVAGPMEEAPALSPEALAGHEAVVRRLAEEVEAILPARFGQTARDEAELTAHLVPRSRELAQALEQVRGCVQMTLRVFGSPARQEAQEESVEGGPGTRYLAAKRRAASLPEIEPLREVLKPLIRAERAERSETGPLLGTVYHLIRREDVAAYLTVVREAEGSGPRFTFSGPWPPYAFAPRFGDRK